MDQRRSVRALLVVGCLLPTSADVRAQEGGKVTYIPLPTPSLTIGTEGDPDYEFVFVGAALRLPTGAIAVSDWRTPTIRLFDANGRLIRTLGREGAGPGEFRDVHDLFLVGDTLIAYDWRLRRLTRFLAAGTLVNTQPVQPAADQGSVDLAGRLASGRWLVTTPHTPNWTHGHGVYRDTLRVGTLAPSATGPVNWVADFPGMTHFAYMPGQDEKSWAVGPLPVAANTLARALGDTIVVGDTGVPELAYFSADGRPVRRIPIPLDAPPDLRQQRAIARGEALARAGSRANRPHIQAQFKAPRVTPWYRDIAVATDRRLWIRLFEERPTDSTRYLILDTGGGVKAGVSLPPRSRVVTVQAPWVIIALRSADDVERVGVIRWVSP